MVEQDTKAYSMRTWSKAYANNTFVTSQGTNGPPKYRDYVKFDSFNGPHSKWSVSTRFQ